MKQNQSRSVHAPNPPRDRSTPTMLVRRTVVTVDRIEVGEWARVPDLSTPTESCSVVAHLSDGTTDERSATVTYEPGERERLLEAVMTGEGGEETVRLAQSVLLRRSAAILRERGELQREYA